MSTSKTSFLKKTRKCVSDCNWNFRAEKREKNVTNHQKNIFFKKKSVTSLFRLRCLELVADMACCNTGLALIFKLSKKIEKCTFCMSTWYQTCLETHFFAVFLRKKHHSVLGISNLIAIFFFFFSQSNIALTQILKHTKIRGFCGKRFPQKWSKFIFLNRNHRSPAHLFQENIFYWVLYIPLRTADLNVFF